MQPIEFETELQDTPFLRVPKEASARLPKSGHAKVIVLVSGDAEDTPWSKAAYEQFMKEDSAEDSVYDAAG
jgi:hypothetical protein